MERDPEIELQRLIRARTFHDAATLALETYGPEVFGFLVNFMGSETSAADVFSQTTEDFWRGLPHFRLQCLVRTWLYVLARNAGARYRRSPWNRGARTGDSQLDAWVDSVRTRTAPWLRTDVKDRWQALRESLDPDDRALLVLRVDRDLSWEDVARVTMDDDSPEASTLAREATRLRKRFQLLKTELRKRAIAAGLVEPE